LVIKSGITRHLLANPRGLFELPISRRELYLRKDEFVLGVSEFIDFPNQVALAYVVPHLLNQGLYAELQKLSCVFDRDFVFVFGA
jgi:hypothetical protein